MGFRFTLDCPRHLFAVGLLLTPLFSACGASTSVAESPPGRATPNDYTWDNVCDAASERLQRCPKEEKADGPFVRRCPSSDHDRACFNTFDGRTEQFLMECIQKTPCGNGSIFGNCAEALFTEVPLPEDVRQRQEQCRAHVTECNLNFEERCIAPFLKDPLRAQMWICVEKPCAEIRRCAESMMEQEGCQ